MGHSAITVDASGVSAAQIAGDPDELRRVVRNLIDNARRHARTTVDVELSRGRHRTRRLIVSDDGPGIPQNVGPTCSNASPVSTSPEPAARDAPDSASRSFDDIVTRHNGTITIDDSPRGGARFEITLPTR